MDLPATQPVMARDRLDIANLVAYLRRETRDRPVAVLTVAPGQHRPYLDAAALADTIGGAADIVTISTDALTHAFSDLLNDPMASTYRGACRVYPPGTSWEEQPLDVPLRMARTPTEVDALPRLITQDLHRHLTKPDPSTPSQPTTATQPAPAEAATPTGLAIVATAGDAATLAAHLQNPARTQPSVVVSRSAGAAAAYPDVTELRNALAGLALVHEITTLEASWAFSRSVPDMCQVYGGASRVYPTGTAWLDDPYQSPLRFAYSPHDRVNVTRHLLADAMSMASAGHHTTEASPTRTVTITGEVTGIAGGRAIVKVPGQFPAAAWPELVEPGLPAEQIFRKGMKLTGPLDHESRRIDVRGMRQEPATALHHYRAGDTILARVTNVTTTRCTLELFPHVEHTLTVDDVAPGAADLRDLLSLNEVLPVWFGGQIDGEWLLSIPDADPDSIQPAGTVLTGGPPWLVPPTAKPATPTAEPDSQPTFDGPATTLAATPEVVAALRQQIEQQAAQLHRAELRLRQLDEELTTSRTQRRLAVTRRSTDNDDGTLFLDPAEQLTFEINLAWARMTQPGEKRDHPLRTWSYGPEFITTLHSVDGIRRAKVVEVIVHVLTGRHIELASRELHQLRTGRGGDDPPVTRAGGETCWRVSLQIKTPSARRLHYWQCNDGSIELSSIRVHDDTRP